MGKPVAIVVGVGAERGLGGALCRRFAAEGHHVLVAGRPDVINERGEDGLLGIEAIAEAYWQLHRQARSAWAQEIDLRPFKESF
jgi:NAD(P)-dependent dehydrogenase (short-subunit alcohol dehydrogenase family)